MLKRFIYPFLMLGMLLSLHANGDEPFDCFNLHHKTHTSNFIAPVFDFTLAAPITETMAASILGEIGPRSYRFGGTVALFAGQSRWKISGEELGQDLHYQFSTGKVHRWVNQYAVGALYQFLPCPGFMRDFIKSFDVDVSYSRAFSRNLRRIQCEISNPSQIPTYYRQISGARNAHFGAGLTLSPWACAELSLTGDWDHTRFVRRHRCDERISGFGGTVNFFQLLPCNLNFDIALEFRRPFNYYAASFGWSGAYECTYINASLYGSYTQGRMNIPNVSTIGIAFDIAFGGNTLSGFKTSKNNSCCPCFDPYACCHCIPRICDPELLAWISIPAVYMPVVLAKASEVVFVTSSIPPAPPCTVPSSTPFPYTADNPLQVPNPFLFDASTNFSGSDLVYSISPTNTLVTIDPSTGILSSTTGGIIQTTAFTITATNSCGTTRQVLWLRVGSN